MTDLAVELDLDQKLKDDWLAWSFRQHRRDHRHCELGDVAHFNSVGYFTCDVRGPIDPLSYDQMVFLVQPGWVFSHEIPDISSPAVFEILHYSDGSMAFKHECKVDEDRRLLVMAPPLLRGKRGHHVNYKHDELTIEPSIVCPNCDLHGFVWDGVWAPACPPRYFGEIVLP